MNFIMLREWGQRNISLAKHLVCELVDRFNPGMSKGIQFHLRPPGHYGSSDPMRQLGEVAWMYKGYDEAAYSIKTEKVTDCEDCPFHCGSADGGCTASKESRAWHDKGVPPNCELRKEPIIVKLDMTVLDR